MHVVVPPSSNWYGAHLLAAEPSQGRLVAYAGYNSVVLVYGSSGKVARIIGPHRARVTCIGFAPPADPGGPGQLLVGCDDGSLASWNWSSGRCHQSTKMGRQALAALVAPTWAQGLVVAGGANGGLLVWRYADKGSKAKPLVPSLGAAVVALEALPACAASQQVVAGCADGSLHLVDVQAGQVTSRLAGHKGMVQSITCWAAPHKGLHMVQEEQHEDQRLQEQQQEQQQQEQQEQQEQEQQPLPSAVWVLSAGEDARVQLWKLLPPDKGAASLSGASAACPMPVSTTQEQQKQQQEQGQQEQGQQEQGQQEQGEQQGQQETQQQAALGGSGPPSPAAPATTNGSAVWSCGQRPAAVVLLPVPPTLNGPTAHRAKPWAALQQLAVQQVQVQPVSAGCKWQCTPGAAGVVPPAAHQLLFGVGGYRGEVLLLAATVGSSVASLQLLGQQWSAATRCVFGLCCLNTSPQLGAAAADDDTQHESGVGSSSCATTAVCTEEGSTTRSEAGTACTAASSTASALCGSSSRSDGGTCEDTVQGSSRFAAGHQDQQQQQQQVVQSTDTTLVVATISLDRSFQLTKLRLTAQQQRQQQQQQQPRSPSSTAAPVAAPDRTAGGLTAEVSQAAGVAYAATAALALAEPPVPGAAAGQSRPPQQRPRGRGAPASPQRRSSSSSSGGASPHVWQLAAAEPVATCWGLGGYAHCIQLSPHWVTLAGGEDSEAGHCAVAVGCGDKTVRIVPLQLPQTAPPRQQVDECKHSSSSHQQPHYSAPTSTVDVSSSSSNGSALLNGGAPPASLAAAPPPPPADKAGPLAVRLPAAGRLMWAHVQDQVLALAWHPGYPRLLAVGCADGSVAVFDVASSQAHVYSQRHEGPVTHLAWVMPPGNSRPLPDTSLQLSGGFDAVLQTSSSSGDGNNGIDSSHVLPVVQPSSQGGSGSAAHSQEQQLQQMSHSQAQQQQQVAHSQGQLLAGAQLWSLGSEGCLLTWPAAISPAGQLKQSSAGSAGGGGRGGRGRGGRGAGRGGGSQSGAQLQQQQPVGPQPIAVLPRVEAALQAATAAAAADLSNGTMEAAAPDASHTPVGPPAATPLAAPAKPCAEYTSAPTVAPTTTAAATAAAGDLPTVTARPLQAGRQQHRWEQLHITCMAWQPSPGHLLGLGGSRGELLLLQPTPSSSSSSGGSGTGDGMNPSHSVSAAGGVQLPMLDVVVQTLLGGGALTHLAWSVAGGLAALEGQVLHVLLPGACCSTADHPVSSSSSRSASWGEAGGTGDAANPWASAAHAAMSPLKQGEAFTSVTWTSPTTLATGHAQGSILLWSVQACRAPPCSSQVGVSSSCDVSISCTGVLSSGRAVVGALAASPVLLPGQLLSGSQDHSVRCWDLSEADAPQPAVPKAAASTAAAEQEPSAPAMDVTPTAASTTAAPGGEAAAEAAAGGVAAAEAAAAAAAGADGTQAAATVAIPGGAGTRAGEAPDAAGRLQATADAVAGIDSTSGGSIPGDAPLQLEKQPPPPADAPLVDPAAGPPAPTTSAPTAAEGGVASSRATGGRSRRKVRSFVPPSKRTLLPGVWDALQQLEQQQPATAAEAVLQLARSLYPLPGEGRPVAAVSSEGSVGAAPVAVEGQLMASTPPAVEVLQALATMMVDTALLLPPEPPGACTITTTTTSSSSSSSGGRFPAATEASAGSSSSSTGVAGWLQPPLDAWAALQFIQGDVAAFIQAAAVAAVGAGRPVAAAGAAGGSASSSRGGARPGGSGVLAPEVVALAAAGGEQLWRATAALAAAQQAAAGDWEGSAANWLAVGDIPEALRVTRAAGQAQAAAMIEEHWQLPGTKGAGPNGAV